jgi:hypothetical protein
MSATRTAARITQDDLAEFADAALGVILQHGTRRPSVEIELDLWNAFQKAYRREHRLARWLPVEGTRRPSRHELMAALARAAFAVALKSGVPAEGLHELEIDLLFAFGTSSALVA